ncbi:unnamed protein product [Echinostoma caproni]|uniref:Reverse transcriptase domain-containing protein n=1 Tax=Echinostoma caproni TaxID=27848 RepID=A0A3P8HN04_9TREM|nr:unnamed protein product [Echinostoma caproni]
MLSIDLIDQLGLAELPVSAICHSLQSPAESNQLANRIIHDFPAVFEKGLGHCIRTKATLTLVDGAKPVFRTRRLVPYAALPLVDAELKRRESLGILAPIPHSAWAAPIVVVKKANGELRICADYSTGLNTALNPNHYMLPVPEDLFTVLKGGTCSAKLDLSEAYFQIEVDQECQPLLTSTHRGLFKFTRLPFGVKTAPAIFQQIVDTMLPGLPGTAAYLDDISAVGTSTEDLHSRLKSVLQRIQG